MFHLLSEHFEYSKHLSKIECFILEGIATHHVCSIDFQDHFQELNLTREGRALGCNVSFDLPASQKGWRVFLSKLSAKYRLTRGRRHQV